MTTKTLEKTEATVAKAEAAMKTGVESLLAGISAASKTAQTIGIEWAGFAKESYEHSAATAEKLSKAGTFAKALEIQTEYLKGSFERGLAQAASLRDLHVALAKDLAKPFESFGLPKAA
ncbi:phasin family protein [Methylobacterium durans]|nr:phasin family protein [Methylobacterium durans]